MMPTSRPLLVAALLAGCGTDAPPDPGCDTLESSGVAIDGAATLGLGGAASFEAIGEGSDLELELGTQGGWMVRPLVRIDAAALGAAPGVCVWAESTAIIEGSADPVSMIQIPTFDYSGEPVVSNPLLVLLSFDLESIEGQRASIEVRVEGPEAASSAVIDVVLVNLE